MRSIPIRITLAMPHFRTGPTSPSRGMRTTAATRLLMISNPGVSPRTRTWLGITATYRIVSGNIAGPRFTNDFHRISNSMEISLHSHLESNRVIATKFCTWHDSCAVVAFAIICRDLIASNGITAIRSFHRIWIPDKKNVREMGPRIFGYLRVPLGYAPVIRLKMAISGRNVYIDADKTDIFRQSDSYPLVSI